MMDQYHNIKNQYKDHLILFRVGDFFELFFDDAIEAHKYLNITLTKKTYGTKDDPYEIPMCGMPHHSYLNYCYKLVMAGFKIVVCDQMETPEEAKLAKRPVVNRSITKILTKSTIYYEEGNWDDFHHFLMAITYNPNDKEFFIIMMAMNTNDFFYKHCHEQELISLIKKIGPEEILINKFDGSKEFLMEQLSEFNNIQIIPTIDLIPLNNPWQQYKNSLIHIYQTNVNTLITYLIHHGISMDHMIITPQKFPFKNYLNIHNKTIDHLHLLPKNIAGIHSIFQILDGTETPMGKRLLKQLLLFPSMDINEIYYRQSVIKFCHNFLKNNCINFSGIGDLSKHLNSGLKKTITPLNLLKLCQGIQRLLDIFKVLQKSGYPKGFNYQCYFSQLVINTMNDEIHVSEGNIIRGNNIPELQEYGHKIQTIDMELKNLLDQYMDVYNINIIKIKWDQRNGYFMESPKSQESIINTHNNFKVIQYGINYIRFITHEFLHLSQQKQFHQNFLQQINQKIFQELLDKMPSYYEEMDNIINEASFIDVFKSLSSLLYQNWVLPSIDASDNIDIQGGFHPLIKQLKTTFINNDLKMIDGENFHIITGPNMGGKSTFLRQNALIIILAQMGGPIPAQYGHIGIVDNIFTRIGSDDNLLSNESTFMVEMKEMTTMIKESTHKSFLVIDELGRGTSINDGLAIAQSIVEYFNDLKCRCLFSTHFHDLYKNLPKNIKYYYCDYYFNPQIVFTYKIIEGITNESFGLHVAQLAGIPASIIHRAQDILSK